MSVVASLGAITPIVCVGTHADKYRGSKADREAIETRLRRHRYGSRVSAVFFINGHNSTHIKEVKQCLIELAKSQHLLKKEFPASYRVSLSSISHCFSSLVRKLTRSWNISIVDTCIGLSGRAL